MRGNVHARFGGGEKVAITSKPYLFLYRGAIIGQPGNSAAIFLTPARLADTDGNKKDVLLMYANFNLGSANNADPVKQPLEYLQDYRVFNVESAGDVFVKVK